jgi:hypothetical protein
LRKSQTDWKKWADAPTHLLHDLNAEPSALGHISAIAICPVIRLGPKKLID